MSLLLRLRVPQSRTPILRIAVLTCIFGAVALAITWPLAIHLGTHLPLGSEHSSTVPYFNLWTLWWNVDRLSHAYQGVWDAPIFTPTSGAFAFSEPQFLTGLLAAPIWLVSDNGVLAYNCILLLFLTLNGAATYLLMRGLSTPTLPSLFTALLMETLPFTARELGVLELVPLFGIILTLRFLYRFSVTGNRRDALGLGLSFALTFYLTGQYALMLSLMLVILFPLLLNRGLTRWQTLAALLAGVILSAALIAPVALKQRAILHTFNLSRSLTTIARNSARLPDYARLPESTLGYLLWNRWLDASTQRLYPGTGIILLGLLGAAAGLRRSEERRWIGLCLAGVILAFVLSFGPTLDTSGIGLSAWQPYVSLRSIYPGLDQFRSPFRFGLFVQIFCVLLAGSGLRVLYRDGSSQKRTYLAIGLATLTLLELFPAPIFLTPVPALDEPNWVHWLADQPENIIIAHAPFPQSGRTVAFQRTTEWMLYQMNHHQPMVNGYSGFFPESYDLLNEKMHTFPDHESLSLLKEYGVVYIVGHTAWLDIEMQVAESDVVLCLTPVFESQAVVIFSFADEQGCP